MKIISKVCCVAIALTLAACSGTPARFETSKLDASQIDRSKGEEIETSSSGFQLLLFFPLGVNGRQKAAYEELRAQAGDRVITDIQIVETWKYALVGTVYTTTLRATVYPTIAAPAIKK